uniref:Uncharacterized protein n=1 Tax=Moniliophthora roreri TaxID=221103 RepID=A0A0W0GCN0_MONRR
MDNLSSVVSKLYGFQFYKGFYTT